MKIKLFTICLLLVTSQVFALSECKGTDVSKWNMCTGTLYLPFDKKYVGNFKNGKKHGHGTFTFTDGATYVGEFDNDKYNGKGTFTFANGLTYVGYFRDNRYVSFFPD